MAHALAEEVTDLALAHHDGHPASIDPFNGQAPVLLGDKESLGGTTGWTQIKMDESGHGVDSESSTSPVAPTHSQQTDDKSRIELPRIRIHDDGADEKRTEVVNADVPTAIEEATSEHSRPPPSPSRTIQQLTPTSLDDTATGSSMQGSEPQTPTAPNGPRRFTTSSSMAFVVSALQSIGASKEARRRKQLGDSVQRALTAIKELEPDLPDPEIVFEPLQLATVANSVPLATTALDCIGKLISHSYFSTTSESRKPSSPDGSDTPSPLIERAIDTIIDCFQGEATPVETQLQIVKSLLGAVLNDKIVVHGAGLLKAVRQTYNIFLLSKSSANQQVAQATLTQMVGTVFERVKTRITLKEARMKGASASADSADATEYFVPVGSVSTAPADAVDIEVQKALGSDPAELAQKQKDPFTAEAKEKITLQSFENRKSFDDDRINDDAPTRVTRVKGKPTRSTSTPTVTTLNGSVEDTESAVEDEEDEIYIKDAFLVFRAMCKLSIKTLPTEQLLDLKSHGMRSKLLSLHLIHTILNNHIAVFVSPASTIRSSNTSEPTSFVHAVKQYLCLSLSRNGASSVNRVFEVSCEIFWLMLKHMRDALKKEIEVFLKEIYLAILDKRNAPIVQKRYLMSMLERLSGDPRALVELYLNYDCDRTALDNMFQRVIEHLSKLSSTSVPITAAQQQLYQEQHHKSSGVAADWQHRGTLPPSLSTANVLSTPEVEVAYPPEYSLKRQSLDCLVETLRSLVNWSQQGIADATTRLVDPGSRTSVEPGRDSVDALTAATNGSTPKVSNVESSRGSSTPMTPSLEDDPSQLEKAKQRKTALLSGIKQFNFKAKRGIKVLLDQGFISSDSAEAIAQFLLTHEALDKATIGEYLGEGEAQNIAIMHAFVDQMDFIKTRFVDALRRFLQSFRLPGEAQKIDRFMLKFAERYISGNPNAFANADTAYVLAYSVIMLNTDQHSSKLKGARMTKADFIKNNRGINDNADLPDEYLGSIYDEIHENEIILLSERDAAAALGIVPQPSGGLASNIGQVLATVGRDLQREAYVLASDEMASKTEQQFRNLVRSQRKNAAASDGPRFIAATSFKHVGPMFQVTWMSFFSGLSGQIQDGQDLERIQLCIEGFKLAIRIACLFDLDTPRTAFVSALAKFTNLNNLSEMVVKSVEALKALLDVAQTEGNLLHGSWRDVLTCISQLDRFQLISTGVDEGVVPDMARASIITPQSPRKASMAPPRRLRPKGVSSNSSYLPDVAQEIRSTEFIRGVDRIFTNTANLSGDAIQHFVKALSEVSWQEIQSSGQSESPRTFSLQKLVEISYYNMTRVKFEWTALWQILGEHFNQVGCHPNINVVFIALDSLRQLSMRFLEMEELPGFRFQKDFLKPFEHVMANSEVVAVKSLVLDCLIQMIQARGDNIRSGWRTMFGVFTAAAREPHERIVNVAFDHVSQIYRDRFGVVVAQGAFADLMVCLTEFSKNRQFQKKSLQAIELMKSTIPKMLKTPECPIYVRVEQEEAESQPVRSGRARLSTKAMQEEQFWFPVLFALHNVLMTGEDLEVRSRALQYLFEALIRHGGSFSPEFWDILWRQLLYPIFMVLKSKSEMSKVLNHEELSVWLSTTMIQALRNMISLFTHYFDSLEYMLDRFLDLLTLCICQENDTIARIGSNCLQQLILQNVTKFDNGHWTKIVGAFVELFERTTANQLFSAATSTSNQVINGSAAITKVSADDTISVTDGTSLDSSHTTTVSTPTSPTTEEALPINGVHPIAPDTISTNPSTAPDDPDQQGGLEDHRPSLLASSPPIVVTAARRRFFNKIITRCVLQLLMIETVHELFSNDAVYARIPSPELLRLMSLLKKSFLFARRFNADKDLRMRLWREGFMKQPPNLLKQESGSASGYVAILLRMYRDDSEERRRNQPDTEAALIPLCADIIRSYISLDEDSQQRNILAWRPVVVDVLEGYATFPADGFEKHIETFYPLAVDLLARPLGSEVRTALRSLLRRIGIARDLGVVAHDDRFVMGNGHRRDSEAVSSYSGGGGGPKSPTAFVVDNGDGRSREIRGL